MTDPRMTDPRMTPTNDAPVTVEQCDRDLYALIAPDMCALILDGELDQHRELQAIARHRLAALASAPAGDGVEAASDDGPCTDCYDTGVTIQTERPCSCGAAALARPRAAVGERDSILRQAAQEAYRVCAETRHVQLGDKARDAILALQSPPAKVEG